jgi:hypothetical protein
MHNVVNVFYRKEKKKRVLELLICILQQSMLYMLRYIPYNLRGI